MDNPFEPKVLKLVDPRPSSPPEAYMTDGELEEGVAAAVVTVQTKVTLEAQAVAAEELVLLEPAQLHITPRTQAVRLS